MKIDILTLFPDMFAPLEHSIVGKAKDKGLLEINYHNFRENAEKARHVDDDLMVADKACCYVPSQFLTPLTS